MASVLEELKSLASVDLFKTGRDPATFIGRPFACDYTTVKVLINDKWKNNVGGVPAGAFLLCFYDGESNVEEAALLRVIEPTPLPTDSEVISSMVEYYKEDQPPGGATPKKLDTFTRYEFMFSGLKCRVLGTYYRDSQGKVVFGADLENFYSAHNYSVFKPRGRVLEYIVNFREGEGVPGGPEQTRLGTVRYSASRRQDAGEPVPIYVSALDFVGKRTALFGMTRTGKSNTVKKILESICSLSSKSVVMDGQPLKPVGQIIFDVNGEYANESVLECVYRSRADRPVHRREEFRLMAYSQVKGRRPFERASKIAHAEILNNPAVQQFVQGCTLPAAPAQGQLDNLLVQLPSGDGRVTTIIAVDGGSTEVPVRKEFPSASISSMTFGPLLLTLKDLKEVDQMPFIGPEDMVRFRNLERYNLTLPVKGVKAKGAAGFADGVRATIQEFFAVTHPEMLAALRWLLSRWTVRLLLPRKLVKARLAYLHAAREQLATPLHPSVVETLEWLFPERKRLAEPGAAPADTRYLNTASAFRTSRYRALYEQWLDDPRNTLWMAGSPIVADAIDREHGRVECVELSRQYLHLSPLVDVA